MNSARDTQTVKVIPSATAPFAFAIQFHATRAVVYLVRKGREADDEAALAAQIIEQDGKTLRVAVNGERFASETRFTLDGHEGDTFRFIAAVR